MKILEMLFTFIILSKSALALEEDYFQKEYFESPKRSVSIIASPEGFYPTNLTVFAGEEIQFFVTGSKNQPSCFIVDGTDLYLAANPGEISEGTYKFERVGKVRYYCPQGKLVGFINVLEHPEVTKQKQAKRSLASDREKVKIWRPRDE